MGIYIPGMEMPTSCAFCRFCDGLADTQVGTCAFCMVDGKCRDARTNYACPLVPVPPHGRLIDGDALKDAIDSTDWYHQAPSKDMVLGANSAEHQAWYKWQDINAAVYNAPTIIPADKEGEG